MSALPVDAVKWLGIECHTFKEGTKSRAECVEIRDAVAELIELARNLAALADGLDNSNSSAEEAASRLAHRARDLVARYGAAA